MSNNTNNQSVSVKSKRGTLMFRFFIFLFIGGYIFFFTSKIWMPTAGDATMLTKIGSSVNWNDREMKLLRWQYSPDQKLMEVELAVNNKKFDGINNYKYEAVESNGTVLKTNVIIEDPDWIIVQIEGVSKKFSEVSFRIMTTEEDANIETLKLYTNTNDVSRVDKLEVRTRNGYLVTRYEEEITNYQNEIDDLTTQVSENESQIKEIKKEIKRLLSKKDYETEEEKTETNILINEARSSMKNLQSKNDANETQISEYQERISNLQEKINSIGE